MKWIPMFLLLTATCVSQDAMKGALGLEFGATMEEVTRIAASRGWRPMKSTLDKHLVYAASADSCVRRIDLRFENGGLSWFAARTRETICCGVMQRYLHRVASLTAELGFPPESLRRFDSTVTPHNDERDIAEVKAGHAVISDHWQLPSRYPEVMSMAHIEITQKGEMLEWYLEKGVEGRMLERGIK